MSVEWWALSFLAGVLAQFVDMMTGMGFGVIASSLMLAAGLPPVVVVATVNAVKVGNGLIAGLAHWGFGNVRREWLTPLSISGVVGALIGATLIGRLPEGAVRLWVSMILSLLGGVLLFRFLFFARGESLRMFPEAGSSASEDRTEGVGRGGAVAHRHWVPGRLLQRDERRIRAGDDDALDADARGASSICCWDREPRRIVRRCHERAQPSARARGV